MVSKQITWDETNKRIYETGVDRGVLYVKDPETGNSGAGEGWDGLTKVSESPDGGDTTAKYANNGIYLNLVAKENFKGTISAFTYPVGWANCDGSKSPSVAGEGGATSVLEGLSVTGQTRSAFDLSYRTLLGNDSKGTDFGYKINLVYNATAGVTSKDFETVNDSPDAIEFSWDFTTIPVKVPGMKPSAHLVVDSTKFTSAIITALETVLYGTESVEPRMPSPTELIAILGGTAG